MTGEELQDFEDWMTILVRKVKRSVATESNPKHHYASALDRIEQRAAKDDGEDHDDTEH